MELAYSFYRFYWDLGSCYHYMTLGGWELCLACYILCHIHYLPMRYGFIMCMLVPFLFNLDLVFSPLVQRTHLARIYLSPGP